MTQRDRTVAPSLRGGPSWVRWGEGGNAVGWPRAGAYANDLQWKLRYDQKRLTDSDLLVAAEIISCWRQLVWRPERERREIIRHIRAVEETHPYKGDNE